MENISRGYDNETLRRVQNTQKEILKEFIQFCEKHHLEYFMVFGSALGTVRHQGTIPWDDDIDVGMMRDDYEKLLTIYKEEGIGDFELLTAKLNSNYATGVTHLQNRYTTFISDYSKNLKCHLGINIDIFPFDKVSENENVRTKQFKRTFFYRRMLFLVGTSKPNIPYTGLMKYVSSLGCFIIHWSLKLLGQTAPKVYSKFEKSCRMSNSENSDLWTSYGDYSYPRGIIKYEEIFPLKKARYEDLIVNIPNNVHAHLVEYYGDNYMEIPPKEKQVNHYPYKIEFTYKGEQNVTIP